MLISIVIPALNEEKTIGIVLQKAIKSMREIGVEGEVIVADNSSTDNTFRVATEHGAKVLLVGQRGYGFALQAGFAAAQGQYIIMADADGSYNLEEIGPYIDKLESGYDFVMGNRYQGIIFPKAMPFLHQYLGTPVITFIMNSLFKTNIGDVNCGMRAFRKDEYSKLNCHTTGMEFASEMIIEAQLKKLKIGEVPCNLYQDKRGKRPHLNTWRDGWRHLRTILSRWVKSLGRHKI